MVEAGSQSLSGPNGGIDKESFTQVLHLQALRISKKECQKYMKLLQGATLDKSRIPCIRSDGDSTDTKLLLLSERLHSPDLEGLEEGLVATIREAQLEVVPYSLSLGYAQLTADQVLKKVLPAGMEVPSSFETVGHIAHLNLKDEALPFKHIIGQVLLDKNPHIKTVVNKVANIENEYRVSQLEVIAGKDDMETEVRQYNARFRLNFSEVYWNSRLEAEHKRLVDMIAPGSVVMDVMAGIGPFAIPATQRNCTVYANDLNPRSFHWLQKNILLNKVASRVFPFCMDGREFVRYLCGAPLVDRGGGGVDACAAGVDFRTPAGFERPPGGVIFQHAIMNLPATAVHFLDAFNGAFGRERWQGHELPTVHCYMFSAGDEDNAGVKKRVEAALGGSLDKEPTIRFVRDVAPNKRMLCVSLHVPAQVAFAQGLHPAKGNHGSSAPFAEEEAELISKRPRLEDLP